MGDLAFASYSSFFVLSTLYETRSLEEFFSIGKPYIDFLEQCKINFQRVFIEISAESADIRGAAKSLVYSAEKLKGGKVISEELFVEKYVKERSGLTLGVYNVVMMRTCYMLGEYERAYELGKAAIEFISFIPGFHEEIDYLFYQSLVLLALCQYRSKETIQTYLQTVKLHRNIWNFSFFLM